MKKIALILVMFMYSGMAMAGSGWYGWHSWYTTGYSQEWGWGDPIIGDTVLESSADTKFEIVKKDLSSGGVKYRAILALVAHEVSTHGAKFCLNEIFGYYSDSYHYNEYQNPYVPGDFQCAWFCEPGYDGVGCAEASGGATACDMVDYEQAYSDLKSNAGPSKMFERSGNSNLVKFFRRKSIGRYFEQHVILGVIDFKKHGIVAQPMVISTNGTGSYWGMSTGPASGGIPKTLCALGYTKNDNCDLSSTSCSNNVPWCRYWREDTTWGQYVVRGYDSNIHYKEPAEEWIENANHQKGKQSCYNPKCKNGFAFGSDLKCSSCTDDIIGGFCDSEENENNGQCMKCNVGQYFDKDTCTCKQMSKIFDKKYLESGPYNDKQCWPIGDLVEYRNCVLGEETSTSGDSGDSGS